MEQMERPDLTEQQELQVRVAQLVQTVLTHPVGLQLIKVTSPVLILPVQRLESFKMPAVLLQDSILLITNGTFQLLKKRTRT